MSSVLKISEACIIAFHTMFILALFPDKLISTNEIATQMSVSENHLAKILQRLVKVGFVDSIRGPKGGFKLAKQSSDITLLEIYETIEGPLVPDDCLLGEPLCSLSNCMLGDIVSSCNKMFKDHLKDKKLSDVDTHFKDKCFKIQ